MLIAVIIEIIVGLICSYLGYLIWIKQKINLLHSYHYQKVKKEDIPAYTKMMGIGLIVVGSGVILQGIFDLFNLSKIGNIFLYLSIIIGLLISHRGQKKYNGSWFS